MSSQLHPESWTALYLIYVKRIPIILFYHCSALQDYTHNSTLLVFKLETGDIIHSDSTQRNPSHKRPRLRCLSFHTDFYAKFSWLTSPDCPFDFSMSTKSLAHPHHHSRNSSGSFLYENLPIFQSYRYLCKNVGTQMPYS
ncbi:hypothetical protein BDN72DRAFT_687627 [Pluteus cervinus]|uniref:Uncharacterized protein n=1 Tax=Pluteus cervinus TaxID=181527 RepID=A0ACD2ZZ07_9AGAR|nr:hypothetical protein BDN72DRAFT_687627 [Pluteus cervinus]